eukprot:TRINITY_DN8055_c2_g1_i1.p1 TRINITY_DN8055_c2_g1~~TRINITY_DN8055_c2_g1_i1.p1  ORF type:complete len:347 (+),score=7.55 TRINITY_DN8055_c2_g1_i1:127-1167(+)
MPVPACATVDRRVSLTSCSPVEELDVREPPPITSTVWIGAPAPRPKVHVPARATPPAHHVLVPPLNLPSRNVRGRSPPPLVVGKGYRGRSPPPRAVVHPPVPSAFSVYRNNRSAQLRQKVGQGQRAVCDRTAAMARCMRKVPERRVRRRSAPTRGPARIERGNARTRGLSPRIDWHQTAATRSRSISPPGHTASGFQYRGGGRRAELARPVARCVADGYCDDPKLATDHSGAAGSGRSPVHALFSETVEVTRARCMKYNVLPQRYARLVGGSKQQPDADCATGFTGIGRSISERLKQRKLQEAMLHVQMLTGTSTPPPPSIDHLERIVGVTRPLSAPPHGSEWLSL